MNLNIHIERLILDGVALPRSQHSLVQAAAEAELTRLLAADGLAAHLLDGGSFPSLPGGNIQLSSNGNPGVLGQQIAQAVHGGIGGAKP